MVAIFAVLLTVLLEHYLQGLFAVFDTWRAQPWGRAYFQWGERAWPRSIAWAPEAVLWGLPGLLLLFILLLFHSPIFRLPLETAVLFFCLQPLTLSYRGLGGERAFFTAVTGRFAVLCWFAVLGPFGALMYYLCAQRATDPVPSGVCGKVYPWLVWFPAQITGLLFALMGSFSDAWRVWSTRHEVGATAAFIRDCGVAATRGQSEDGLHGIALLLERTAIAWIMLILIWLGLWA